MITLNIWLWFTELTDWLTTLIGLNFILCAIATGGWLYVIKVFFFPINKFVATKLIAWGALAFLLGCTLVNFISLFADLFKIAFSYIIPSRALLQTLIGVIFIVAFGFVRYKQEEFRKWAQQFKGDEV